MTPEEAGLNVAKWNAWVAKQKPKGDSSWGQNPKRGFGTVITYRGRLLKVFGDPDYRMNNASVGKAFTSYALQLAIDEGLIEKADDPIHKYWTGEGALMPDAKRMDRGHHQTLTFLHLHEMQGGFPISNGRDWARKKKVPDWAAASWTGDATADNYAHIAPGAKRHYSSGGRWRLSQALTAVWKRNLKSVLDEKLFGPMGIAPEDWTWASGRELHDNKGWYPEMRGYGEFCDPPYEIGGVEVLGGGGWVDMSPSDLARVGLLVAARGKWKGKQLVSDTPLVQGHAGGNASYMNGWSESGFSWGQVTTRGVSPEGLADVVNQ